LRFIGKGLGSKVSTLTAIAIWGFSMFLIYNNNYATPKSSDLLDVPIDKSLSGEFQNWMNVTMNGTKIGYTTQTFANTPLGYVLKDYSLIRLPMGGTVKEIYLDSYAVLNLDFSLKNFTFGLVSGDYTTDIFGEYKNGRLDIKLKSQNSDSKASFKAENGIYLPSAIPLLASLRGFPGGEFSLPTFDPMSLAMEDIQVKIGSEEDVVTDIGNFRGHKLSLNVSGISSDMWVEAKGHVLKEAEAGGMVMLAANKDDALNIPQVTGGSQDLLTNLAVPCDGEISNARDRKVLRLQITGLDPGLFSLDDDFQKVISADPLVLDVHTGQITSSTLGDSSRFLSAEPFLQVDDPRIIAAARVIVGQENLPLIKAQKICDWVFHNVKKDYSVSLPSAIDVLTVKKGDCNEHTSLYTALARAAGIPTKVCIGIVYNNGMFFYHAWPAVFVNGWHPLDPTFGQTVCDATHIKLLEGGFEKQADLMRVVGKIKVKIINDNAINNL
jgi:hypothetical protein